MHGTDTKSDIGHIRQSCMKTNMFKEAAETMAKSELIAKKILLEIERTKLPAREISGARGGQP